MIHEKYLKYSETLLEAEDYILSETEKILDHVLCHNKIDICVLNQYHPYLKKRILMKYLEGIYQENLSKLTDIHLSHLLCLMESEKYNDLYFLPLFKVAKKRGNIFVIEDIELLNGYSYEFTGVIQLPNGKVIEQVESENNTNYYCRLNKSDVHFPLFIRTRKNGDRMTIKNMNGTKKINDIFTDLKIPSEQRDVWPILVDSLDNILWLPGLKKSSFDIEKENNCDIILKYH
jgi:tRNA(Ile)-lysidine synthetase-like protein